MLPTCGLSGNDCAFAEQVAGPSDLISATNSRLSRFRSILGHIFSKTETSIHALPVIILVFFILCPQSVAQTADRPETGTYIRDTTRSGYGLLVIYNNWTMDTVAVLTDRWDKPKVAVYLRTKDAVEIDGIKDGEYSLYFTIGDGWNSSAGDFETVYNHVLFPPMVFETDDTDYTIQEVELQKADATNFVPGQFQFPDISSR